jgi:predicted hotdog family 3-hydroxylacyl-ACP dehydratase
VGVSDAASAPLEQQRIRQLIPHAGRMCLLDRATYWDAACIRCTAMSHLALDNPLRRDGLLRTLAGIEYAAQAMALHGALLQGEPAVHAGYLVSVRNARCAIPLLDGVQAMLEIDAERLAANGTDISYAFALRAGGQELLSARATVVLAKAARLP